MIEVIVMMWCWASGIRGGGGLPFLQESCTREGEGFWEKGAALGFRETLVGGVRPFKRFLLLILGLTFELLS